MKANTLKIGALILCLIAIVWQQVKISDIQKLVDTVKIDTLTIQGKIDTIKVVDTFTVVKQKVTHKVDTVKNNDVVVIYDTTTVYKPSDNFAFDIHFSDTTKSPLVSLWGVANYPSGRVNIVLKPKIDLKVYDGRFRAYYGAGWNSKFGLFTHVTGTMKDYQFTLMAGKGLGLAFGKKF